MTEKQKDIQKRIEEHYSDVDLNKEEIEQRVISILKEISEKVQLEEKQIKQKVTSLLNSLMKI